MKTIIELNTEETKAVVGGAMRAPQHVSLAHILQDIVEHFIRLPKTEKF
jgi:hypothetical protein